VLFASLYMLPSLRCRDPNAVRQPLLGDAVVAARALRAVPPSARAELLAGILRDAEVAGCHGRTTGQNHPKLGDGSMMAAALLRPLVPEPDLGDREYCRCLALVLLALAS
jgi:hypothetical protein